MLTIEGRDLEGGGPIEPSIPVRTTDLLAEDEIEVPLPLTRALFPRAKGLLDGGAISEDFFFEKWMTSVPESEATDGGRDCKGVAVKIEESRR